MKEEKVYLVITDRWLLNSKFQLISIALLEGMNFTKICETLSYREEDEWYQKFDIARKFPSYDPEKNKLISKQLDTEDINPFKHSKTTKESEVD